MSAPTVVDAQGNRLVQAKGGHKRHILPEGTRVALCGHAPYGQRGGWWRVLYMPPGSNFAKQVTCAKCLAAYVDQIL